MPSPAPALRLMDITRRFGATTALDEARLDVARGTVHALLGENGAGKTTLMRVAFGLVRPDAGTIAVEGRPIVPRSPVDAIRAGIGMVHQHFTNVPAMTVAENVALGGRGRLHARAMRERVRELGARSGLTLDPDARVADLPVGAQQRLEILKALGREARILILDEPTAVLAPAEAQELLRWLRGFADAGGTAILITHKLAEALAVSDAVTVLRRGRTVLESAASAVTADELAGAMLGESAPGSRLSAPGDRAPAGSREPGTERRLSASHITVRDEAGVVRVDDVSLEVYGGEILGVAAVERSGHYELLRALAGLMPIASGELRLPAAIGFVPEDRQRDALVLDFTLAENVALKGAGERRGLSRWPRWLALTRELMRTHDVRAPSERTVARTLSGGNQQKLVLARELHGEPGALIAENPTRGLDVRATADVHERLRAARAAGMAVVVHSSDIDEVLALATRVVAVHAGRVREVPLGREAVGRAMLGVE